MRVLSALLLHHVQHVVVCDDADQLVLIVNDGNRDEVVSGQFLRHDLLIVIDTHGDHVTLHDPREQGCRSSENEFAERNKAPKPAAFVDDVDVVDRLAIRSLPPQTLQGLADRDVFRQRSVLGRHDRPGAFVRKRQQFADVASLGLSDQGKQRFDTLRVHPFQ